MQGLQYSQVGVCCAQSSRMDEVEVAASNGEAVLTTVGSCNGRRTGRTQKTEEVGRTGLGMSERGCDPEIRSLRSSLPIGTHIRSPPALLILP